MISTRTINRKLEAHNAKLKATLAAIQKTNLLHQYRHNDSLNLHADNAALLANHFGTDSEKQQALYYIRTQQELGYMPQEGCGFQAFMSQKYFNLIRE